MTHVHRTGLRAVRHTPDSADEGPSVPAPWKLRVGIGVPASGTWASGFGFSLVTMIGHFERSHVDVAPERRPEVVLIAIDGHLPDVRTRILGEAVRERCTHLLWLDSDMIFPPDTLHRLLRHNLPIVGANYPRRIFPHLPTAHYGGDPQGGVVWSEGLTGTEVVKHVGFGVCMMDMRLVDMIDPPYFVFAPDGNHGLTTRGEDVYFCEKALRDAKVPTHVDHDLIQSRPGRYTVRSEGAGVLGGEIRTAVDVAVPDAQPALAGGLGLAHRLGHLGPVHGEVVARRARILGRVGGMQAVGEVLHRQRA